MTNFSAFRNDPVKSVLPAGPKDSESVDWGTEPVVSSYYRLTYKRPNFGAEIPVPVCSTPAIISRVGVVVAGYDGSIRLFSSDLAKVYWQLKAYSSIYASVVIDPERRRIIVADTSGTVTSLSLRGETVWSVSLDGAIYATPAVNPKLGLLSVACFGGCCAAIDLESGRAVYKATLPDSWFAGVAPLVAAREPYASPVVLPDGNALFCAGDSATAIAPTGRIAWSRAMHRTIRSSPAVLAECATVVVACVDGSCSFLDCSTGAILGLVQLGDKVTASLAGAGTIAVVGTASGQVFGLDAASRAIIWKDTHGAPFDHSSFSVLPDGTFICTNARGNIVARNCIDGHFLWETSQLIGLSGLEPRVDITPVADLEGSMYCASHSGAVYAYAFRRLASSSD